MRWITGSAVVLSVLALTRHRGGPRVSEVAETFVEPPSISSESGVLRTTLTVRRQRIRVAGRSAVLRSYNGLYVPPTLRVHPGDTIRLRVSNAIDQPTNVHYHGMSVSPRGNSDNIFLSIRPGETFDYEVVIPKGQESGLFWYHPHAHTVSEYQVMNGMSGALIVEGLLDPVPQLRGIRERVLLLKDIQIASGDTVPRNIDSNAKTTRTLNGLVAPTMTIRPGETQLWRIANIGADIFYRLRLDGHVLYEVARDGNRKNRLVRQEEIIVPPATRVEVLVQGGAAGVYQLRTLRYDTGPAGDKYPDVVLATLVSQGAALSKIPLPVPLPAVVDLRRRPITRQRVIVFSETPDGKTFFIDGKQFDPNRIDSETEIGALEEWTIRNDSDEDHVFHIHQLDFQVVEENGSRVQFTGYQETVNVLSRGKVKLLLPFTNPVIAGKFVYHCHILNHEDHGMMATIMVRDRSAAPSARRQRSSDAQSQRPDK